MPSDLVLPEGFSRPEDLPVPARESAEDVLNDTAQFFGKKASGPIPLTQRWWLWPLFSSGFHTLILIFTLVAGSFATEPLDPPLPVIGEFFLSGLAGPGGSGGNGQAGGGNPVAAVEPPAKPVQDAPTPAEEPAAEPEPGPEIAELDQHQTPVLDATLPKPEKKVPPKPEPKPEPKPKPKPKPKPRHKVRHKRPPVAKSQPAPSRDAKQTTLAAAGSVAATGGGTGMDTGGQGPGKGPGQGSGPPGVGGGPGGGGGGSHVGFFGRGNGPRFRHRCLPRYPSDAKRLNKEGMVCLRLTIDAAGTLRDVNVLKHSGLDFVEAALQAIRNSTFYPATHNGHPIFSRALLTIRFKLG